MTHRTICEPAPSYQQLFLHTEHATNSISSLGLCNALGTSQVHSILTTVSGTFTKHKCFHAGQLQLVPCRRLLLVRLSLTSQKVLHLFWNPKVHYHGHKSSQLAPILSQMHPFHTFPPSRSFQILSSYVRLGLPRRPCFKVFRPKFCILFSSLPCVLYKAPIS
jgi:hypothetical protein